MTPGTSYFFVRIGDDNPISRLHPLLYDSEHVPQMDIEVYGIPQSISPKYQYSTSPASGLSPAT